MSDNYQRIEGHPDLAKDANVPGVVINRNKSAYEKAVRQANDVKAKQQQEEEQRAQIRNATNGHTNNKSNI